MKTTVALIALVAAVSAQPWGEKPPPPTSTCSNNQKNVCCQGILGVLCGVGILGEGGSCNGQSYCCDSDANQYGLINLDLLNCAKLL